MVAQGWEQNAYTIQVVGSIPTHTTMKNKYLHAIAISVIGTMVLMINVPYPVILDRFLGGCLIGLGLLLARQSGRDENKFWQILVGVQSILKC